MLQTNQTFSYLFDAKKALSSSEKLTEIRNKVEYFNIVIPELIKNLLAEEIKREGVDIQKSQIEWIAPDLKNYYQKEGISQKVKEQLALNYAKECSPQEIEKVIAFYQSDIGKKILDKHNQAIKDSSEQYKTFLAEYVESHFDLIVELDIEELDIEEPQEKEQFLTVMSYIFSKLNAIHQDVLAQKLTLEEQKALSEIINTPEFKKVISAERNLSEQPFEHLLDSLDNYFDERAERLDALFETNEGNLDALFTENFVESLNDDKKIKPAPKNP